MHKDIQVQTDIGILTVTITGLDHAHVHTASGTFVTVREKEYTVHVHLYMVDGNWTLKDRRDGGYTSVQKWHGTNRSQSSAAPTIAAKVVDYCREALASVLADDPELPTRAEIDSLTNGIAKLTEERNKLLREAGGKFLEIRRLYAQRNKLERA